MGVFSGSSIWWVFLSTVVGLSRHRITPKVLALINRVSGCAIAAFGLAVLVGVLTVVLF